MGKVTDLIPNHTTNHGQKHVKFLQVVSDSGWMVRSFGKDLNHQLSKPCTFHTSICFEFLLLFSIHLPNTRIKKKETQPQGQGEEG